MRCASYMAGTQLILCSFIHSALRLGGGDGRTLWGDLEEGEDF